MIKAWELWFQGHDVKGDGDFVWGLRLIWWGRIGVVAGFLGGLVIIFDLIGEERLKGYGLKRWRTIQGLNKAAPGGIASYLSWVLTALAFLAISPFFIIYGIRYVNKTSNELLGTLAAYVYTTITTLLILACVGSILVLIDSTLDGVSFILKMEKLMTYVRAFALMMLVVSAHFTLLTS